MAVERNEIERRVERFKAAARKAGLKLTCQRVEIFREIAARQDHPNAEAVFRFVRKRVSTVSLDTVYRTLWKLRDLNLISMLCPHGDSARFDANMAKHHHYVCIRCGLARDFENAAFDDLGSPQAARAFGRILNTRVEVRGICRSCEREMGGGKPKRPKDRGRKG